MVRFGNLELGTLPRVAVALSDKDVRDGAAQVAHLVDVFELRVDRFTRHDPAYAVQIATQAREFGVPLLATVRDATEGGEASLNDAERLDLFRALAPCVDAIDIELHAPIFADVVALCRAAGKPIVASTHDFSTTPPTATLVEAVRSAKSSGATIVKLATTVTSPADNDRLLDILRAYRNEQLIIIGMGSFGLVSRVFFPLCGSLLTWGFLHTIGAPGQLPVTRLVDELCRYSPPFARRHGS